jgi:hypothetical protein
MMRDTIARARGRQDRCYSRTLGREMTECLNEKLMLPVLLLGLKT